MLDGANLALGNSPALVKVTFLRSGFRSLSELFDNVVLQRGHKYDAYLDYCKAKSYSVGVTLHLSL